MSPLNFTADATVLPDADVSRALAVVAHPDDLDFGSAGTIASWVEAGIEVTYCILTDGQAGGFDLTVPRSELPRIRREEQCAAADALGVKDVRFFGYADGELRVDTELVRALVQVIREVRPDRLLTSTPERNWQSIHASHPDHLAAGEAATQAVYPAARNPFAFPELLEQGLQPWTVREMWLSGHAALNHAVDVTDFVDRKLTALHAHVSQHPEPDGLDDRIRSWMTHSAAAAGMPAGRLAELFAVYSTA